MSVILTYWQLRDGVADHGFWGGLKYRVAARAAGQGVPQGAAGAAVASTGTRGSSWTSCPRWKAESCPTLDEPADAFARLLALAAGEIAEDTAPPGDWSRCCITWAAGSTWPTRRTICAAT